MCGIAGQLIHARRQPHTATMKAMARSMSYRGPDDEGVFRGDHIGLVHRRLSIRDLSPAGHCPMGSPDGLVQVVFNGEIYNWRELRLELQAGGAVFLSESDTEVILHGYEAWGDGLPARLRGMFAIAVWDGRARRLLLARDRAGEKPLFYECTDEHFVFGSSTEALRPAQQERIIDPVALAAYLAHGFIPASHTVWNGVRVLPPAHFLVVEPGSAPKVERYWDFPHCAPSPKPLAECEKATEAVLDDCVARCLDADVPVGVFLSGGVDSSLIAALAARQRPDVPAFSLGFAEATHNELPYARRVAEHLSLAHHVIEIRVEDVIDVLPHLVRQYGQPFGDSSAVPSYCLARLAREHVTVCLGGDGGDESFGGYWRMQAGVYSARYGALVPPYIRRRVVPSLVGRLGAQGRRLQAMNALSLQAAGAGYTNSQSWLDRMSAVAGPALKEAVEADLSGLRVGRALDRPEASVVQRLLYDDFQIQLPDDYLTKVDVASMAASLEVRSPFLDQALLEFAWTLPDSAKLNWGRRKWLLKRVAARHVPPEVIYRPKMGFAMPVAEWFRGKLGQMLEEHLQESVAASEGWIQVGAVRRALQEHREGKNHSTRLWLILWLELWFRLVAQDERPAQRNLAA